MNEGSSAAFATFDDTLDRVGVNCRLIQSWIDCDKDQGCLPNRMSRRLLLKNLDNKRNEDRDWPLRSIIYTFGL
jgi:hypothetical protein